MKLDLEPGKHGFKFFTSPEITPLQDALRRDFTIGAIFVNLLSGRIFDPFDGKSDLEERFIRAVDPQTFVQSPERVLRGAAQAARFDFDVTHGTIDLMRSMAVDFDTIPVEQIWRHFEKAAKKAVRPEIVFGSLAIVRVDCFLS